MRATQHRLSGWRLPDDVLRAGGFWASLYEVDSQNAKPPSRLKPELLTLRSSMQGAKWKVVAIATAHSINIRRRWTATCLRSRADSARSRRLNNFMLQLN